MDNHKIVSHDERAAKKQKHCVPQQIPLKELVTHFSQGRDFVIAMTETGKAYMIRQGVDLQVEFICDNVIQAAAGYDTFVLMKY